MEGVLSLRLQWASFRMKHPSACVWVVFLCFPVSNGEKPRLNPLVRHQGLAAVGLVQILGPALGDRSGALDAIPLTVVSE